MKILDQELNSVYRGEEHMEIYMNLVLGHLPAFGENLNNSFISNPSNPVES